MQEVITFCTISDFEKGISPRPGQNCLLWHTGYFTPLKSKLESQEELKEKSKGFAIICFLNKNNPNNLARPTQCSITSART